MKWVDVGGWSFDRSPAHWYSHERVGQLANVYPARLNPGAACWQDEAGQARLGMLQGILDEIAVGGEAVAKVLPNHARGSREADFAELMQPDEHGTIPKRIVPVLDVIRWREDDDDLRRVFVDFGAPPAILLLPRMHQFAISTINPDRTRPLMWESVLHRFGGPQPEPEDRRAEWQLRGDAYQAALDAATDRWLAGHRLDQLTTAPAAAITTAVLEACHEIAAALCEASERFNGGQLWHRGLKPSQVLVDTQGQLRVTDFGLSYHHSDEERHRTLSRNQLVGTELYFTPRLIEALVSYDEWAEQPDLVTMADVTAVEDTWALGITAAVLYLHTGNPTRPAAADTTVPSFPFGAGAPRVRLRNMYDLDYHGRLLGLFPPQLRGVLAAFLAPCPNQGRSTQPPVRPGQQQARRLLAAVLGDQDLTLTKDANDLLAQLQTDHSVVDAITLQQAVTDRIDATSTDAHTEQIELLTDVAIGLSRHTNNGQIPVRRQLPPSGGIS